MKVKEGTTRYALVGEHVTFKVPHRQTFDRFLEFFHRLGTRNQQYIKSWFTCAEESYQGLAFAISGIMQNWRELVESEGLGDIVVPTRLSLFGVINMQATAQPVPEGINIWKIMHDATGGDVHEDGHAFYHRSNYGVYRGKVRMLDYGSRRCLKVLKMHRKSISRALAQIDLKNKSGPETP